MFFFFPRSALWEEVPDPPSKGINEEARTRSLLFPRRGSKVPTRFPAKRLHLVCGCWRLSGIGQVGWPAEPAGAQHGVPRCTPPTPGKEAVRKGKEGGRTLLESGQVGIRSGMLVWSPQFCGSRFQGHSCRMSSLTASALRSSPAPLPAGSDSLPAQRLDPRRTQPAGYLPELWVYENPVPSR